MLLLVDEVKLITKAWTLLAGVKAVVEAARTSVALYVNTEISTRYWNNRPLSVWVGKRQRRIRPCSARI